LARSDAILVVGLGRFGSALAIELQDLGYEVLGIDRDPRLVQDHMDELTHVVEADATDPEALRQIFREGTHQAAVVAIGSDIEASILATQALVSDLGVPRVWAKAITAAHGRILSNIGAHKTIFPERDMGVRVAHLLTGRTVEYMELDGNFALMETTVPSELAGRTLEESAVRRRHRVTVVCVKPPGGSFTYATPQTRVGEDDHLLVAGEIKAVEEFANLS
jgi:trk system potassium uptake protein TrkA